MLDVSDIERVHDMRVATRRLALLVSPDRLAALGEQLSELVSNADGLGTSSGEAPIEAGEPPEQEHAADQGAHASAGGDRS